MLKNYLKVAFRNILKDKFYTSLNILGLALGITCFILIMLFINDELAYDKGFVKSERTYRVCEIIASEGGGENSASAPLPLKRALLNDNSDIIETSTRLFNFQQPKFVLETDDGESYIEKKLFFVDSTFFDVFDYPFISGDPKTALVDPFSVVLTKSAAKKYFGDQDPIGKELKGQGQSQTSRVTAVIDDTNVKSHLDFNILVPISATENDFTRSNFYWNPAWTFVVLKEGVSAKELESRFPQMVKKYFPEHIIEVSTMYLMALGDIHLHSNLDFEMHPNSDMTYIYIFMGVALLVLIIACTNFINLATARTANRAKEVGLRKVMGAYKSDLIVQFLGETLLQSFIALLLGIVLAELMLNTFNSFSGKHFTHDFIFQPAMLISFLGIGLITGLVSGMYPAFYLSGFVPAQVLKGQLSIGMTRFGFRQVLVVLQFAISIILIVGTIIAYQQLDYLKEARLGFDKDQVIIVPLNNGLPISKWDAMIKNFTDHPDIENVSSADHIIGNDHQTDSYRVDGQQDDNQIAFISVGENFIETFGINLITGRDFKREFRGDTSYIPGIVNEAFIAKMGLKSPAEAINKKLYKTGKRTVKIIGVAQNFHFASLHHKVTPLVLEGPAGIFDGMGAKYMSIRFNGANYQEVMKHSEATLGEFFPNTPYEFFFLDQNLEALYKTEKIMSKVITTFSVFALLVACMGLLGLTAFAAEKRTKELGVRKVLGATEQNLVYLLSKEFLVLVLIAFAIAVPVSWIGLNSWLNDFAFRVEIEWWTFVLAGLATMALALITVSFQAYKAAHANPIDSLSYE